MSAFDAIDVSACSYPGSTSSTLSSCFLSIANAAKCSPVADPDLPLTFQAPFALEKVGDSQLSLWDAGLDGGCLGRRLISLVGVLEDGSPLSLVMEPSCYS